MAYKKTRWFRLRYWPKRSVLFVWSTHPNSFRIDWQAQVLSDLAEFPGWHSRGMLEAHRKIILG